ncbi:non-ribosomal peptide synthetase [Pseudomonas sp. FFUP_PS_473]|uniref:non-ribosomal peptide synthetase n=1 Tax=Pseudomonas sp. FFUP_PS_473 TaxID=2060418 RepID=UPI000C7C748F|nr:non-ribosomal peptide synthetase [Pseudomonas sp. FFUP_PS_473]PLP90484.1 non-ribosomal peptide synthetase [Pseudomonas sp. FFUP_PS_473]
MLDQTVALELAQRFMALPGEKRRVFFQRLGEQNLNLNLLPIPAGIGAHSGVLSYAQQRLWFLAQLMPQSSAYNIAGSLRLSGTLDRAALQRAFERIVARHETLRSRIQRGHDDQPQLIVLNQQALDIREQDLCDLPAAKREGAARGAATLEALTPFDLQHDALLRVGLLRLADDEHVLLVTLHHIIADGWSMKVLIDEFAKAYAAFSAGSEPELPALTIQYRDYALWQRSWLEAGEQDRQLAYWRQQLGERQPMLELPADHPRPAVRDYRGSKHALVVPAALSDELRQFAQRHGCTLFQVLLGAFQVLLYRYSGQRDLRIGVPIANRQRLECEGLIGFFVNTQVLRSDVDGEQGFAHLLEQVKQAALGAQAHQDLPFEQLVEALQPERSLSHNPLFQVMFNHQRRDLDALARLPGLRVEPFERESRNAQFDLNLDSEEDSAGVLRLTFGYATDLFDAASIEQLARHFLRLLQVLPQTPDCALDAVPLLDEDERRSIVALANNTRSFPELTAVHRLIETCAARQGDAPALVAEGTTLSFVELEQRANRLAHRLLALGVGPDARVGVSLERSPHLLVALLAVLKAGAAYVPLDPEFPAGRLAYMIEDSGLELLLTSTVVADRLNVAQGIQALHLDTLDLGAEPSTAPNIAVAEEQLAYVIYTSGSTGKPKGVMVRHGALSNFLQSMAEAPGIAADQSWLAVTSLSFDIAALELYLPLTRGACVLLASAEQARDGLALQAALEKADVMQATPATWRILLESGWQPSSRHTLICGGEALPRDLAEALGSNGARLWNLYGPTETTIWSTAQAMRAVSPANQPIGRPIAATSTYVLDARLEPVAVGITGELYIGGAGLARGYHQRPDLTAERFVPDPFGEPGARLYRTGDLVRWRRDGVLEYLGRIDHQVKVRGFRIELGEIEAQLLANAEVRAAVVLAREAAAGTRLVGYVAASAGETLAETLKAELRRSLPEYMVPAQIVVLEQLPLTPNGKIDRLALPEPVWQARAWRAADSEPAISLAGIWAQVLGVERVGLDDNFFELGGHSLLATQVISRIRRQLKREVPLRCLFEAADLSGFASAVAQLPEQVAAQAPLRVAPRPSVLPLSAAQQRLWFLAQMEPDSAAYNIPAALQLQGTLDHQALQQAFDALVARHESLRTRFALDAAGQPQQLIDEPRPISITRVPMHGQSFTAVLEEARREALRPFDLGNGPLLRVTLLERADDRWVLLVTLHHIITDGASMGIVIEEFAELYRAAKERRAARLPALSLQYADYALWQQQRLDGPQVAEQLAYWCDRLGGEQPLLELPLDHPRPAMPSLRGAKHVLTLPAAFGTRLRALAGQHGASLFQLLLASYAWLLYRHSGQRDLRIGIPQANRNRLELEGLIGFFVNTQVLRIQVDGREGFAQLLQQVNALGLEAQANQDVPFERLVDALQPERSLSRTPLFQVMFNHQRETAQGLRQLPGLSAEVLPNSVGNAQFELILDSLEAADGSLQLSFTYAVELFEARSIARLAERFERLLGQLLAQPRAPLAGLDLLLPAERQLPAVASRYSGALPIHQRIAQHAVERPDAVALVWDEHGKRLHMSFAELDAHSNQLAQRLLRDGLQPEQPVGVLLQRTPRALIAMLAVLKAGAAYLPLDPELPVERLTLMAHEAGLEWVLAEALTEMSLPTGIGAYVLDRMDLQHESNSQPQVTVHSGQLAYLIYTSGSSGKPKSVAVSHGALAGHLAAMQGIYQVTPDDAMLLFASLGFDAAAEQWLLPLAAGARVVMRGQDVWGIERLLQVLDSERVSLLDLPPSYAQQLGDTLRSEPRKLAVRLCTLGGEAVPTQILSLLQQTLGCQLINGYGPTECVITPMLWQADGRPSTRAYAPLGEVVGARQAHILDADLNPVPTGVIGELYIGGEGLARGYYQRPDLTAERFIPDPLSNTGGRLYRTGDRVCRRDDGQLEYLGRIDQQIKLRGYRIELGEIEACLLAHAAVREALVVVNGKHLLGYVVAAADESLAETLLAELRQQLPDYMVPSKILILERFPLTPNGKVDRKALPEPVWESQVYQAPSTPEERALAAIWQQVLGLEQVGLHDNFFELGGDSIVSIQVVSRARQAGLALTPKDLFQHQTLQALARAAKPLEGGLAIDQGPVSGAVPLTPIQAWFFEQPIPQRHHWNQSVLLKAAQPLDSQALNRALQALVAHHDALRLSWQQQGSSWVQHHRAHNEQGVLWEREAASAAEITAHCDEAQASLSLQDGPLLRAVHIRLADGTARLLLVVHHLVVDGVSWRILLEDLQQAYAGLPLPAKTSAYKHWAEHMEAFAHGEVLQTEVAYWQRQLAGPVDQFPEDGTPGGGIESLTLTLDKARTAQLLKTANAAYRTRIDELLLTALARTLCAWSGQPSVLVDLEGHGREALFADLDLTRTVGWFTSLYPVRLGAHSDLATTLKATKETLRQVPHKGVGYGALRYLARAEQLHELPAAQVTFNYLGQFDTSFGADDLLHPASESAGVEQGAGTPALAALEINCQVYAGELRLSWRFDAARFSRARLQVLLDDYLRELIRVLDHCMSPMAYGVTPSDFPLAQLTQAQLDGLAVPPREIEDIYPLSPMQQGLLFHSLFAPHAGTYINQLCVDIDGLDVERFRAAWQAALERHAILRTGFAWQDLPAPVQVVHRQLQVPMQVLDWRERAVEEKALAQVAREEHTRGFDLQHAPLLRLCLVRVSDQRHRLIWTSHHLLLDGWSNAQLIGEVLRHYADPLALKPVKGGFRDYIDWLQEQNVEASEHFWRARLAPLDEPCLLASAVSQSQESGYGACARVLTKDETHRLREFAQRQRITLNTLVQGAWLLLLQRYTGLEHVCAGVTVAGRPTQLEGVESWLGLFINTLPVIQQPLAEQAVGDYLRALQTDNLAMREHEHTPLYAIQGWAGQGGQAQFDTLVVFENYPVDQALRQHQDQALQFGPVDQLEMTNYPLALTVNLGEALALSCSHDRAAFDDTTVQQLMAQLCCLMLGMARDAAQPLGRLELNDVTARQQLVHWSAVQQHFPAFVPVSSRIAAQAALRPDAVAIRHQGVSVCYAELEQRANQLAHRLIRLGVGSDVLVGVALPRSAELIVALLAVLKAGGAYVPLDPDYPVERLAYMVEDSGLQQVISLSSLDLQLPVQVLALDTLDLSAESSSAPQVTIDPEQLAYVIYTSGSTGQPKGAQLTQRNVERLFQATQGEFGFNQDDVWTLFHSYAFDFSVWEIFGALVHGGSLVIVPYFTSRSPEDFLKLLSEEGVTVLNQTPSAFRQLIPLAQKNTAPLSLRYVIFGGEALELESLRPWFERYGDRQPRLINMYGITETTVHVTYREITGQDLSHKGPSPIGRPLADLSLHVLDANLNPQPVGIAGELYVGGAGLARGYLNRPELTSERFIASPFDASQRMYRSGDLARRRVDGSLEYLGRIDQQVKIRGFRIELGEIEAQLQSHPQVSEAAVLVKDGAGGPRLVGYVASPDRAIQDELKAHLHERLPEYMVPAQIVVLASLPLTANGKLDRRALPEPDAAAGREYRAPQTDTEQAIARIWAQVLDVERVGLDDHFFERGGHSLLAVQTVSRLKREFDLDVGVRELFEHPQLEAFARYVEALRPYAEAARQELQDDIHAALAELDGLSTEELEALLAE